MFHAIACFLTLEDNKTVQTADAKSRTKVYVFAGLFFIITSLWVISGFLLAYRFLGLSVYTSGLVSLITGMIVLFLERSIYHGGKGVWTLLFRGALGLVMAFLGSAILDTMIFSGDIDQQMRTDLRQTQQVQADSLEQVHSITLDQQWNRVMTAENHWKKLESEYVREMEGGSPTGIVGAGPVARAKRKLAEEAHHAYLNEKAALQQLELSQQQEMTQLMDRLEGDLSDYTLLVRFSAMQQVIDDNWAAAKKIYYPLFGFLFILELMVVVLKYTYKETAMEYEQRILEQIRRKHADTRLRKLEKGMAVVESRPTGYQQAVQRYRKSNVRVLS